MKARLHKSIFTFFLLFLIVTAQLFSASKAGDAAWDSDLLGSSIAVNGKINNEENGRYSFEFNKDGVPLENLIVKADVNETRAEGGYDKDEVGFRASSYLWYLGGAVSGIYADKAVLVSNGDYQNGMEIEGENVDLIKGASADLFVRYNPTETHQKGCLWYIPKKTDRTKLNFSAIGGSDSCNINADRPTFSDGNTASVTLRALSIYDPWFDEMEQRYDTKYAEEGEDPSYLRVDNWKDKYLSLTNEEHMLGVNNSYATFDARGNVVSQQPLYSHDAMWAYPDQEEKLSIYADFSVSVREPIEDVFFISHAQANTNKKEGESGVSGEATYRNIENQLRHPDIRTTNSITCYDTSDAGNGEYSVDAFYIEVYTEPDYGYDLEFEIVEGSTIGSLDNREIDDKTNAFRFVPRGKYKNPVTGLETTNYGNVVIKVTAEEVNYSEYFTLSYLPSSLRFVKYIGDKAEDQYGSTVPDTWKKETVSAIKQDAKGRYYFDENAGVQWDVTKIKTASGEDQLEIYGLESLVLYPGEEFSLSAVAYTYPLENSKTKHPFYMTEGYPVFDLSAPSGERETVNRYAVMFSCYENQDAINDEAHAGILSFDDRVGYGEVVKNNNKVENLVPSGKPTAYSYWYRYETTGNEIKIKAENEGTVFLSYTLAPIKEDGSVSLTESTLTGGFYVYVVAPVDQGLAKAVSDIANDNSGNGYSVEIPYSISVCQVDKWFMGRYGIYQEEMEGLGGENVRNLGSLYRGKAYATFDDFEDGAVIPDAFEIISSAWKPVSLGDVAKNPYGSFDGSTYLLNSINSGIFAISADDLDHGFSRVTYGDGNEGMVNDMYPQDVQIIDKVNSKGITVYGIRAFPNIKALRLEEAGSGRSSVGTFVEANSVNGVYDLSSLDLIAYEHKGAGAYGALVSEVKFPVGIQYVDIGFQDDPNNFSGTLTFARESSDGYNTDLKMLDISYNNFSNVTLLNYSALTNVDISGDNMAKPGGNRTFYIYCAGTGGNAGGRLSSLTASGTSFNRLVVGFPDRPITSLSSENPFFNSNAGLSSYGYTPQAVSIMIINASDALESVSVSGGLSYLELRGNANLKTLICTDSIDSNPSDGINWQQYTVQAATAGSWVRVINLGGLGLLSWPSVPDDLGGSTAAWRNRALGLTQPPRTGTNVLKLSDEVFSYLFETGYAAFAGHAITEDWGTETSLETIRIANVARIFMGVGDDEVSKLSSLEIENLYCDVLLIQGIEAGVPEVAFDLFMPNLDNLQSVYIGYAYGGNNARINLKGAGSAKTTEGEGITIGHVEGKVNLQYAGRIVNSLSVNSGLYEPPEGSVVDISYSGITDFHGQIRLTGFTANTDSISIDQGGSSEISLFGIPTTLTSQVNANASVSLATTSYTGPAALALTKVSGTSFLVESMSIDDIGDVLPENGVDYVITFTDENGFRETVNVHINRIPVSSTRFEFEFAYYLKSGDQFIRVSGDEREEIQLGNSLISLRKGSQMLIALEHMYLTSYVDGQPDPDNPRVDILEEMTNQPEGEEDGYLLDLSFDWDVVRPSDGFSVNGKEVDFTTDFDNNPTGIIKEMESGLLITANVSDALLQINFTVPAELTGEAADIPYNFSLRLFEDETKPQRYEIHFYNDEGEVYYLDFENEYDVSQIVEVRIEDRDYEAVGGPQFLANISNVFTVSSEEGRNTFKFSRNGANVTITPSRFGWGGLVVTYESDTRTYERILPLNMLDIPVKMLSLDKWSLSSSLNVKSKSAWEWPFGQPAEEDVEISKSAGKAILNLTNGEPIDSSKEIKWKFNTSAVSWYTKIMDVGRRGSFNYQYTSASNKTTANVTKGRAYYTWGAGENAENISGSINASAIASASSLTWDISISDIVDDSAFRYSFDVSSSLNIHYVTYDKFAIGKTAYLDEFNQEYPDVSISEEGDYFYAVLVKRDPGESGTHPAMSSTKLGDLQTEDMVIVPYEDNTGNYSVSYDVNAGVSVDKDGDILTGSFTGSAVFNEAVLSGSGIENASDTIAYQILNNPEYSHEWYSDYTFTVNADNITIFTDRFDDKVSTNDSQSVYVSKDGILLSSTSQDALEIRLSHTWVWFLLHGLIKSVSVYSTVSDSVTLSVPVTVSIDTQIKFIRAGNNVTCFAGYEDEMRQVYERDGYEIEELPNSPDPSFYNFFRLIPPYDNSDSYIGTTSIAKDLDK